MPRRIALVFLLVLAAAAGCSRTPATDEGGGAITIARRDSIPTFDPAFAWNPEVTPYLDLVFDGLVAFDDSGRVGPACAERWSVSADGTTYRFTLREGLEYADGRPLVAADFAHGIARLFRPGALRSPGAVQFVALEGARRQGTKKAPPLGARATDARTLVLTLDRPDAFLLEKLAQPRYALAVPETADQRLAESYGAFPKTNGPFRLVRAGRDTLLFVRTLTYHGPRPAHVDTVRILSGRLPRQALLGFESGRVDLIDAPAVESRPRLARGANVTLLHRLLDPPIVWYFALNAELAPLARRDARRAFASGVNRQHLVEALEPFAFADRDYPPYGDAGGEAPGFDPQLSRAALDAAKYAAGIRVPVTVPRSSPIAAGLDALAPSLAQGGIQTEAVAVPLPVWSRAIWSRRGLQAGVVPWQAPAKDALDGIASLLLNRGLESGWGGNVAWFRPDGGLDSLLLDGLAEADTVRRASVLEQVGTLLDAEVPLVPLARIEAVVAVGPGVRGATLHPRRGLDLRAASRTPRSP